MRNWQKALVFDGFHAFPMVWLCKKSLQKTGIGPESPTGYASDQNMRIPVANMKISVLEKRVGNPCLLNEKERLRLIAFLSSPELEKFEWDIKLIDAERLHAPHRAIAIGSSINGEFDFGFMLFKRIDKNKDGNSLMESRDISIDMGPSIHPASPPTPPAPPEMSM